ncbi:MAG: MFS transporter [Haloferacaceae archaeon]
MNLVGRVVRPVTELLGGEGGRTLLAVAGAWFLALGTRIAVPAVLPHVRADVGIDNATAGAVVTTLWVAYALTQFPSGLLTDRIGERRMLVGSMILGALGTLVLGLAGGLAGLVAGVLLYGLGTGVFATPRVMIVSRVFPHRATTALGVVFAAGNVGNTVLPALAGLIAAALGWRVGFLAVAPLFVLAAVGLRVTLPDTGPDGASGADAGPAGDGEDHAADGGRETPDVAAAVAELRRRPVGFATVALVLFAFAYQGLIGFLPTYLVDAKGLAPGRASLLFGAFFAAGLVAQLAVGSLADRHGRRPLLVATLAVTVAGLGTLTVAEGTVALAGIVLLLGVQLGFWPVVNAYAYDALSDGARGGGYGFVRTIYLCLGATGPLVVGVLFDAGRYDGAFLVLVAAFALVALVCAALPTVEPPAETDEAAGTA